MNTPVISELSWGQVRTPDGTFKDVKLWPGGSREWDWGETGTSHDPGVQAADLAELLDGVDVVVVGCGQQERLGVTDEARAAVADAGAELVVLASPQAVDRHNGLVVDGIAVATLLHSSC